MNATDWVPVAQLASGFSAATGLILTALTIGFTGLQMRRSRRTVDLQALQKFSDDANRREAALAEAQNDQSKIHAFHEFLNFLELYACAYNHHLIIGRGSKSIVRHKLLDSYIVLEAATEWRQRFEAARDSSTTFHELTKLVDRHRKEYERRRAEREHALTSDPKPVMMP